jgi:probable phosphoglycerate mutase
MIATRILAVRHGETLWNRETRIQGFTDIGLSDHGQWQAQQLAQALREEPVAACYASDLSRARDTAQAVADVHGHTVHTDPGLRERGFGCLEGNTYAEIEARWPEDARAWRQRDLHARPGGGESLSGFYKRCLDTATLLVQRHPGQSVALVAHGGVLDCLYRAAVGVALDVPRSWQLGNATVNRLLWTPQGFSLVGWNDDQHLQSLSVT